MPKGSYLLAVLSCAAVVQAGPKVTLPENSFDFGKTIQQSTLTHHFWIKSAGTDTLRILEIKPGCGCTQMPLEDSTIAPGDSARLGIIFKTGRFNGLVVKAPSIKTNASAENQVLKIYANVLTDTLQSRPLAVHPVSVDVSQFGDKTRRRAAFTLQNHHSKDFKVTLVDAAEKSFTVELPEVVKAGASAEGRIIVDETKVESSFSESFTFQINDESNTRYTVPVIRVFKPKPTPNSTVGLR